MSFQIHKGPKIKLKTPFYKTVHQLYLHCYNKILVRKEKKEKEKRDNISSSITTGASNLICWKMLALSNFEQT